MPEHRQYWIERQGKTSGPFGGKQIVSMAQSGLISQDDLISTDGFSWHKAGKAKGLFEPASSMPQAIVLDERAVPSGPGSDNVGRPTSNVSGMAQPGSRLGSVAKPPVRESQPNNDDSPQELLQALTAERSYNGPTVGERYTLRSERKWGRRQTAGLCIFAALLVAALLLYMFVFCGSSETSVGVAGAGGQATERARDGKAPAGVSQLAQSRRKEKDAPRPKPSKKKTEGVLPTLKQRTALDLGNNVTMKLVLIPAGKFLMGSPDGEKDRSRDEGPQHEVTISKPFYIGVYEVTQEQYEAVMGTNPSLGAGEQKPVNQVSWDDAVEFCKKLSQKTGRTVQLPTEAQWEYACRAGSKTAFCYGDDGNNLGDYAWYDKNSNYGDEKVGSEHPVGQKKPNAWGLYDMHGNVWEWCADWFADSYANAGVCDPEGPASGTEHVARGGCYLHSPARSRSAKRTRSARTFPFFGFRVVTDAITSDRIEQTTGLKATPAVTGKPEARSTNGRILSPDSLDALWAMAPSASSTSLAAGWLAISSSDRFTDKLANWTSDAIRCQLLKLVLSHLGTTADKLQENGHYRAAGFVFLQAAEASAMYAKCAGAKSSPAKTDMAIFIALTKGAMANFAESQDYDAALYAAQEAMKASARAESTAEFKNIDTASAAYMGWEAEKRKTERVIGLLKTSGTAGYSDSVFRLETIRLLTTGDCEKEGWVKRLSGIVSRYVDDGQAASRLISSGKATKKIVVDECKAWTEKEFLQRLESGIKQGINEGLSAETAAKIVLDVLRDTAATMEALGRSSPRSQGEAPHGQDSPAQAPFDLRKPALDLGNNVAMKLVLIPAGKFMMGSPENEKGREDAEGPRREVTISKPFYMGAYEVTQEEYEAVMGKNPSTFKGMKNPVEQVSWDDANAFCRKLSQKTGKTVSLPTEAQWEYACRAGTRTRFGFGDDDTTFGDHAWYGANSKNQTHPVGQKKPNAWGLYDMHGNVWEWCSDWHAGSYANAGTNDPQGPGSGTYRVVRGGGWRSEPRMCRTANRARSVPNSWDNYGGFRVVVDRE